MLRIFLTLFLFSLSLKAQWLENTPIPEGGRSNPYGFSESDYKTAVTVGKIHAQVYPVKTTALLAPLKPTIKFLDQHSYNPLKEILQNIFKGFLNINSLEDIFKWIGLHPYPKETDTGVYSVPYPDGKRPNMLMGVSIIERGNSLGFTIGCMGCHSGNLFGKTVLGMTNRFPRANGFFLRAKNISPYVNTSFFQIYHGATRAEVEMVDGIKENLKSVRILEPMALGLDTSLSQVALSLAMRDRNEWATKNKALQKFPRPEMLETIRADSKPAVWWNLKYKNRWLSDGSIVSGNPVFTNFLWNEIGRGIDLKTLDQWLTTNEKVVNDLTTAVFSTEAPLFTDFFPAERIDLEKAKAGEKIFLNRCAKCHGTYEKAWNASNADSLSAIEKLKTTLVKYKSPTPVKDVGTDPLRYLGMKSLEQLNYLEISRRNGTVVVPQTGYVPPPLVGIWARWPYLHNNSVPTLCALLSPAEERPITYYSGPANQPEIDFDSECNGYPLEQKTPSSWRQTLYFYDTRNKGLGNEGHDEGIFVRDGVNLLSKDDRAALIQFLQTL